MEEEKKTNEEKTMFQKLKEETEKIINKVVEEGIQPQNIEILDKLVDIHKDISNEEYWETKKEEINMRYRDSGYGRESYGEYGDGNYGRRGVPGTGRGRYRDSGYSGGRGSGRYRGHEMLDEMMYHYGNYSEGSEQYGADEETMKSFKYMLKSFKDYYKHLKQEASSQQEIQMLEQTAREMLEM